MRDLENLRIGDAKRQSDFPVPRQRNELDPSILAARKSHSHGNLLSRFDTQGSCMYCVRYCKYCSRMRDSVATRYRDLGIAWGRLGRQFMGEGLAARDRVKQIPELIDLYLSASDTDKGVYHQM